MGLWDKLKGAAKGIGGYAVGGPIGAVAGVAGKKLWGGIKSTLGGQASYQPTAPKLDQTQLQQDRLSNNLSRQNQGYLLEQLQNQIDGNGPSVAAIQAKQGIAQALANAGTMAANARGVNRGMALREATYAGQQVAQQANRDAAVLRANEQLGALGQYGQQATAMRTGDLNAGQLSLEAAKADQGATTQEQWQKTQLANQNAERAQKGTAGTLQMVSGIAGALLSDERSKENLRPITPYSFSYKPEFAAAVAEQMAQHAPPEERDRVRGEAYADARAPREGVMAQDLEKSPGGKKVVKDTPMGKVLDGKRSISFALANQAGLDKRLRRIEEVLG